MNDVPSPKAPRTADGVRTLIRKKFPSNEYAVFFEVRNATGFAANRSADAMAFSLWPSRGLEVSGFEVKVSRADWIKEMRDPAKAESIARYCDRWWLVVSDEKIVADGELPSPWGLMVARAGGLHAIKTAPKLDAAPLDRAFVAAICRSAQAAAPGEGVIRAAVEAARRDWEAQRKRAATEIDRHEHRELETLQRTVKAFEDASGIKVNSWEAGKIGHAVNAVMGGRLHIARDIEIARNQLKSAIEAVDDLLTIDAIHRPIEETKA